MKQEVRTAIVMAVVIGAGVAALSIAFSALDRPSVPYDANLPDKSGLRMAPDLAGISHHINTTPNELAEEMEGKVVLYDIWTYSCVNCIRTLPYITAWDAKYADQGLLIIGVHSPEFEFEKVPENVQASVLKHGISYPVVMDNDMETWKAFENRYWPRKYVADHEGYIRYDHIGEGGYRETERVIQQLLRERSDARGIHSASAVPLVDIPEFEHSAFRTPELYLGYHFAQNRNQLGSEEGFQPGRTVSYAEPADIALHKFYPVGDWANHDDSMELAGDAGRMLLLYHAKEVNIVTDGDAVLEISLDGEPLPDRYAGSDADAGVLTVSEPGMYNIISGSGAESHILEIGVRGEGFRAFTFTFG